MNWNPAATPPPMRGNGQTSAPVMALLDNGETIPAEFWQSSLEGQPQKWYKSRDVYKYDCPYMLLCNEVIGWVPIKRFYTIGKRVFVECEE